MNMTTSVIKAVTFIALAVLVFLTLSETAEAAGLEMDVAMKSLHTVM